MAQLEEIGPDNWKEFLESDLAVLMIGKSTCEACKTWGGELSEWLATEEAPDDVRFGKLLLDQRGLIEFKKASPWLAELDVLPFNVVYVKGEKTKDFAGGGLDRLKARLERVRG